MAYLSESNRVRIAPSGHYRGFHSMLCQYLMVCNAYNLQKGQPYMDLSRKITAFHPKDDTEYLTNPWNNYFIQEIPKINEIYQLELVSSKHDMAINPCCDSKETTHLNWKKTLDDHFLVKPHILEKVNTFVKNEFYGRVAGIHIRSTDTFFFDMHRPNLPLNLYIDLIEEKLGGYDRILIATDSQDIINIIKNRFGSRIIYYNCYRSSIEDYHFSRGELSITDPYFWGEDPLVESILLSKVELLIRGYSNVAVLPVLLNPFMKIHNVDLKFFVENLHASVPFTHEDFIINELEVSNINYYLKRSLDFEIKKKELLESDNRIEGLKELIRNEYFK